MGLFVAAWHAKRFKNEGTRTRPPELGTRGWTYTHVLPLLARVASSYGSRYWYGLVLRYDEASHEMVGLTVISLKERLVRGLGDSKQGREGSSIS